jgi:hypothetical protein
MLSARSLASRLALPLHRALYHANVIDHYENPRNVRYRSSCFDDVLMMRLYALMMF